MADDIVTRLRDDSVFVDDALLRQAADEIERLRAENTRLASFLHPIGATIRYDGIKNITSDQVDQILKEIRNTHRG